MASRRTGREARWRHRAPHRGERRGGAQGEILRRPFRGGAPACGPAHPAPRRVGPGAHDPPPSPFLVGGSVRHAADAAEVPSDRGRAVPPRLAGPRQQEPAARPDPRRVWVDGSVLRALMQFAFAAMAAGRKVEVFCFGTRLTRVTRSLRTKDPDRAMREVGRLVADWEGGTRIGPSIKQLLDRWSQRTALR